MSSRNATAFALLLVVVSSVFLLHACKEDESIDRIVINYFTPSEGIEGSTVIIEGYNFGNTADKNVVKFSGTTAVITSATATSLTVIVPTGATTGQITVEVGSQIASSTQEFSIITPPTISSFTPATGTVGSIITIEGTNFSAVAKENVVMFNGETAFVTESSNTRLTVVVPARGSSGKITVKTGTQTVISKDDFTSLPVIVSTLAGRGLGDLSGGGFVDGISTEAKFRNPYGVATDAAGNVYVADLNNFRIRKITPAGVVSTFAGSGSGFADGAGNAAKFSSPHGVAVDAAGNVYVTDYGNNRIRKITPEGVVSTLAGNGTAGFADGNGTNAQFNAPAGIAVDAAGNVYVGDSGNHSIRKITSAGVVSTLAGNGMSGFADGTGTAARFNGVYGVAVDVAGNVYAADTDNHRIRKITSAGLVTTLAGNNGGFSDGLSGDSRFSFPTGVAVDASGNVYVADQGNKRIRKVTPTGVVVTFAGSGVYGWADGSSVLAAFRDPSGVCVDANGNVYVGDQSNNCIRKINTQ